MAGQTAMSTPIFDELLREMAAGATPATKAKEEAPQQSEPEAAQSQGAGRRRRPD
ncbi:hypothetical protein [Actinokineospora sp. HUAS TT18]|uniref:hypothetical protein n=1 Tax=Actinokineospora sp. HUAS TT18 TaxID=3447451 RepID=UPI003F521C75